MGSFDPSRIKLPSQRSAHSATSRSVAADAATAKKRRAAMSWRISCYSTRTSGAAEESRRGREFQAARRTIAGYEAMHMIRKGQLRRVDGHDLRRQIQFIHQVFELAA
jgi:hypothetical protein